MSEHLPKPEVHKVHEKLVDAEHHERIAAAVHEKAEKAAAERSAENLKLLHEMAKQEAEAQDKTRVEQQPDDEPDSLLGMQQSMKTNAYDRTLRGIQQKLPKTAHVFSKVAHNKTIEAVSNAGAKTVARPSGILGGSICAFLGSVIVLYYSKHYGFTYNYALFLLLFIGGFLVGALIELTIWSIYRSKHGRY